MSRCGGLLLPRGARAEPVFLTAQPGDALAGASKAPLRLLVRRTASAFESVGVPRAFGPVGLSLCRCMLKCMQSTSVRIDASTHEELKRLAADLNVTVGHAVTLAVRALRQDRIGEELTALLRKDETAWLDADLG